MSENKKSFLSKINIIDILIVALVVIFLVGGITKLNKVETMTVDKKDYLEMEILFEDVTEGLKNSVESKDIIRDSVRGFSIGEVVDVESKVHKEMISSNNKIIYTEIPGKYDVVVRVKGKGLFDGNGVLIGSRRYFIGTTTRVKSSKYVSNVEIINVEKSEE